MTCLANKDDRLLGKSDDPARKIGPFEISHYARCLGSLEGGPLIDEFVIVLQLPLLYLFI